MIFTHFYFMLLFGTGGSYAHYNANYNNTLLEMSIFGNMIHKNALISIIYLNGSLFIHMYATLSTNFNYPPPKKKKNKKK